MMDAIIKNIRLVTLLMAGGVVILLGCDVTDDRSNCPTSGSINLVLDWDQVNKTEQLPDQMQTYFYGENKEVIPSYSTQSGCNQPLAPGCYRIVLYNQAPGITVENCAQEFGGGYIAVDLAQSKSSEWVGSGEPLMESPTAFYSWTEASGNVEVQIGQATTVRAAPQPYVKQLEVVARMTGDFVSVVSCAVEVSGLVQQMYLSDRSAIGSPASIRPVGYRTDAGYNYTAGVIGKFKSKENILCFLVDYKSQRSQEVRVDVTKALIQLNDPQIAKVIVTADLWVSDKEEVGLGVKLLDWNYVSQGNVEVDYKE